MNKILTTLMVLSFSMSALGADNIDKQLAKDCVSESFFTNARTGQTVSPADAPENWKDGRGSYSYWPRYEIENAYDSSSELCRRYGAFTHISASQIAGKGRIPCAAQGTVYRVKVRLNGKNRFGEDHNEDFTCYFTGRNYDFHSSWN
jgi:hypothetical protein